MIKVMAEGLRTVFNGITHGHGRFNVDRKTAPVLDQAVNVAARREAAVVAARRDPSPQRAMRAMTAIARYLEPALIPLAAAIWLYNLLALLV